MSLLRIARGCPLYFVHFLLHFGPISLYSVHSVSQYCIVFLSTVLYCTICTPLNVILSADVIMSCPAKLFFLSCDHEYSDGGF